MQRTGDQFDIFVEKPLESCGLKSTRGLAHSKHFVKRLLTCILYDSQRVWSAPPFCAFSGTVDFIGHRSDFTGLLINS